VSSLELGSFAEHCDRVLPRPFVRWLCLLSDMETLQFVNLKQVVARILKVVELKVSTEWTRACFFTAADANHDPRSSWHNTDIHCCPVKLQGGGRKY
jgi:hypothetical protein